MVVVIASVFLTAALAPWLMKIKHQALAPALLVVPLLSFVYFLTQLSAVSQGDAVIESFSWFPALGLSLTFYLDGLSLLFALLITGIGTFIVLYASDYLHGHQDLGRFYLWLFAFMGAMLGLVLSDNLLSMFIFWELTSITSYMLIGFNHETESSRKFALQGLFVTVGGGLLLMTGFIMLALLTGSWSLVEITQGPIQASGPYVNLMLILLLMGAFTKSAQFPFHFWLPNAMAAPTPVSAFLHSATMVKAGVFLMARLHPALFEQVLWSNAQLVFGSITMVLGAFLAYTAIDLKKVLAYSTVMALGTLTFLLGIGTKYALIAFVVFLLGHSLYKASLFMLAGAIDHSAGTKKINELGGLRHSMPITFVVMIGAALSLAGLPPLFGFIGKELLFEAGQTADIVFLIASVVGAIFVVAVAITLVVKPFLGPVKILPLEPHEPHFALLAGPVVLVTLSLLFGLLPSVADTYLVQAAVASVSPKPLDFYLSIWHGVNVALMLSILSLFAGGVLAALWLRTRSLAESLRSLSERVGPEALYFKAMSGLVMLAAWQTRVIQNGKLGNYMITVILATIIPVSYTLFTQYRLPTVRFDSMPNFYEWALIALMMLSTAFAIVTRSRFASIISLGALGFSVALVFILFSAPDLGITQVLVETLTVLLLVLVLIKVPGFARYSSTFEVIRDASVAILVGIMMTILVLIALDVQWAEPISGYFIENSYELGKGRNIVNVILVDFRALDTLGEIFVLAIAALGVYSMIRLRGEQNEK